MRLKRFDTSKIKVRGADGRRMPGGRAGGVGCGGIVVVLIGALVFGADPAQMLQLVGGVDGQGTTQSQPADNLSEEQRCTAGPFAEETCNALASLNETWEPIFANSNIPFEQPELVLYPSGPVSTRGCGNASSAAGPFYCPADKGIYIDTTFFTVMERQMGAGGDFARLYVMAHEYGHHIQNLVGTNRKVRQLQQSNPSASNQLQVRMELQADCYAGVWAGKNRDRIESGDMEEGLRAASAIGDDTIQRRAGQRVKTENFTHGSSAQRMEALRSGIQSADSSVCDVYMDF